MSLSRRNMLNLLARAGGAGLAYSGMAALGLTSMAEASELPKLANGYGNGKKVLVLGGGIAGLTAAYELRRAGFLVELLESRDRPGGRNWTVRRGSRIDLADGSFSACLWDEGQYLNAGCARIPSQHHHLLSYCRELGVEMEAEINTSRSALLQSSAINGGKPVQMRQAINDTRGHISELLAKAVNRHTLDDILSADDTERLLAYLKNYGDLDKAFSYMGSSRSGYSVEPGAGVPKPPLRKPLSFSELLKADFSKGEFYEEYIDWQATMMQPVGGIDHIPYAFAKTLGAAITYNAPVKRIDRTAKGVRVVYAHEGADRTTEADYCVCAIPPSMLKTIPGNMSRHRRAGLTAIDANNSFKHAWQAQRFWEREYQIYGGLSFLREGPIDTVWYPSYRLGSDNGVIISGFGPEYEADGKPTLFGSLSLAAKAEVSREAVERLHPGHGSKLTKPVYIPWLKIPYSLGGMFGVSEDAYALFNEPDGRLFYAGDWLSRLNGWQEGAVLSAHRSVAGIARQLQASAA